MRISGMEKMSLVDYPGKIATTVFVPGCNFNCFFCHNRPLLNTKKAKWFGAEIALAWLVDRKDFLDALVISGGEPTLQDNLVEFIEEARELGYLIKLDTNGMRPDVLGNLINKDLLDYVAMDIKAPSHKYDIMAGVSVDNYAIHSSIDILLNSHIDYEFRTTVVPQLGQEDILDIAQWIRGAKRYVLQQYRKPNVEEDISDIRLATIPHAASWPFGFMDEIHKYVAECTCRGFEERENVLEMQ